MTDAILQYAAVTTAGLGAATAIIGTYKAGKKAASQAILHMVQEVLAEQLIPIKEQIATLNQRIQ